MKMIVSALALLFIAWPASGQVTPCLPHNVFVDGLRSNYGETLAARAITHLGGLFEIFAAPGGTFTVLITTPTGKRRIACVFTSGRGFEIFVGAAIKAAAPPVRR